MEEKKEEEEEGEEIVNSLGNKNMGGEWLGRKIRKFKNINN